VFGANKQTLSVRNVSAAPVSLPGYVFLGGWGGLGGEQAAEVGIGA